MTKRTVGALVFPGFEMLDLYGPLELFGFFPDDLEILAVAETAEPVRASNGPATLPDRVFADGTGYDILLIPGGRGTRQERDNPALMAWLRQASAQAEIVTSVCTGSLLLAVAGVLDGRRATTNKLAYDQIIRQAPSVDWQRQARWVRDGAIYTASGVSAGMDMALAVITDLLGAEQAMHAALWAEYIRNPDPDTDPFATGETTNE